MRKVNGRSVYKITHGEWRSRPDNCGEVPDRYVEYDRWIVDGSSKQFGTLEDAKKMRIRKNGRK